MTDILSTTLTLSNSTIPAYPFSHHFHSLLASRHTFLWNFLLNFTFASTGSPLIMLLLKEECQTAHMYLAQLFGVGEEGKKGGHLGWRAEARTVPCSNFPLYFPRKQVWKQREQRETWQGGKLRWLPLALFNCFSSVPYIAQFSGRSWVLLQCVFSSYLLRLRAQSSQRFNFCYAAQQTSHDASEAWKLRTDEKPEICTFLVN